MTITMHRGDTKQLKFRRLSGGEPITTEADQIYFTVKRAVNPLPKEPVLQKTLADMAFDQEYYYHLTIEPEDTDELDFVENREHLGVIINKIDSIFNSLFGGDDE